MIKGRILNREQREAAQHGKGPLLIIAGAGTGKTTVITERVKHLILEKKILPSKILALTFTEKAAREMEERVDIALPYGYTQMWISTFHAFCDRILRNEAIHIGLNPSYLLMTEPETILFLRKNIFKLKLRYFRPLGNPNKFLGGMLQHFSRLRDEDISPEEYIRWAQSQKSKVKSQNDKDEVEKNLELANSFKTYQEMKAKEGVMDFSDLITSALWLFRQRKNILKQYQEQFKYILVDEFQDTNFAQNELVILLAGKQRNITVVGDDDQAIYRWRGAAISNIIQFQNRFPKAKIVTLTKNYRSTQEILDASYKLIQQNNPDRLEVKANVNKKLTSQRNVRGTPIDFLFAPRVEDEAELVVKKIRELTKDKNYEYKDVAILVRANDHAQSFVRALERSRIPYQFLGPGRLFHQEEVKDLIAYLKVLYNFEDSIALYRVLNISIFHLEPRDIAALLNLARRKNVTLFEALESEESQEKLKIVLTMIQRHLKYVPKESAGQILYYFLKDSGLLEKLSSQTSQIDVKRYQNIARFFDKLKSFEAEHEDASVFAVVDWIDLSMQMGESPMAQDTDWSENNAVNILTIHSSKGLEFPIVFIVNLVTQRFPTRERSEQIPIPKDLIKEILPVGDYHIQEERRLFYVGMTRAKDHLALSSANFYGEGKRERKISPFVYEVFGEKRIEKIVGQEKKENPVNQLSLLEWSTPREEEKQSDFSPSINYLSFSQIQSFDFCPLHYKLRYVLKIPSQPTAAQSFGTSIHAAFRDFYQQVVHGEKPKKNAIVAFLKKQWIDEGYLSQAHQKEALEKAEYIITQYVKNNDPATIHPMGVEVPFQFFVKDLVRRKRSLKIGGRIDRVDRLIDNKIEIIDYKTGSNIPSEHELTTNLQLTLYGLAAVEVNDVLFNRQPEDVVLSLYYLEEGKKLTTTRTKEQLVQAKESIFQKLEEIEQSDFSCSGSTFCQNCEYKMLCRV